jgi:hypothetical protein
VSVEPAGMRIDASTEKPLWVQLTMLLANRSFSSLRSRKNAMTLWRKQALSVVRSMGESWTNRSWRSKLPSRDSPCQWRSSPQWQHASGGRIQLVTVAPERRGALEFIQAVSA